MRRNRPKIKRRRSVRTDLYARGIRDGQLWRTGGRTRADGLSAEVAAVKAVQRSWRRLAAKAADIDRHWFVLLRKGKRYARGFLKGAGIQGRLVPVPVRGSAAAVVYAPREASTMKAVLKELRRLPLQEIVVVLHEASLRVLQAIRSEPRATVAFIPDASDPDVGRALGAKLTTADSVLFVDGEKPANAEELARFLWVCDRRMDVALNDISARLGSFRYRRNAYRLAEFLNRAMNRRDLRANTLSVLPYALSRDALNAIGPEDLEVPLRAHVAAVLAGLRIGAGGSVVSTPLPSVYETGKWAKMAREHEEAWRMALNGKGKRLYFPDRIRNRSVLEEWT